VGNSREKVRSLFTSDNLRVHLHGQDKKESNDRNVGVGLVLPDAKAKGLETF